MTEPPRRLDPTPAQRVEMAIERSAGGVAGSGSRYSRPVPSGGTRSYAHGIPAGGTTGQALAKLSGDDYDVDWASAGGGGPAASAQYTAPTPPTFVSAFDCSNLYYSTGPVATYFGYDFQLELLLVGWYQATASATVAGATAGDLLGLDVTMGPGTNDTLTSWATANGATVIDLTVSTPIFYASAADFSISAACINAHLNNHGSGTGTISSARITLVAF